MKKIIVVIVLVLCVVAVSLIIFGTNSSSVKVDYCVVTLTDISSELTASGTAVSNSVEKVFFYSDYPIVESPIPINTFVKEGDILLTFDTNEIQRQIKVMESVLYDKYQSNQALVNSLNKKLENANNQFEYEKSVAVKEAENQLEISQDILNAALVRENNARRELREAREYENEYEYEYEYDYLTNALSIAPYRSAYSIAIAEREAAETKVAQAKEKLELAKQIKSGDMAHIQADINAANSKTYSSDYSEISILQELMDVPYLYAPCDGTITSVNISNGEKPNGLVYVIENLNEIEVLSYIKEYDIAQMKIGNKVTINFAALNNIEFEGIVNEISPTTLKNSNGEHLSHAAGEVAIKIKIIGHHPQVMVGMSANLMVQLSESKNTLVIPFNAIRSDSSNYIYIAVPDGEEGRYVVERRDVVIGIENGLYSEIICDNIMEGDIVLISRDILEGQQILLNVS